MTALAIILTSIVVLEATMLGFWVWSLKKSKAAADLQISNHLREICVLENRLRAATQVIEREKDRSEVEKLHGNALAAELDVRRPDGSKG
jgi:hypothetical protein